MKKVTIESLLEYIKPPVNMSVSVIYMIRKYMVENYREDLKEIVFDVPWRIKIRHTRILHKYKCYFGKTNIHDHIYMHIFSRNRKNTWDFLLISNYHEDEKQVLSILEQHEAKGTKE